MIHETTCICGKTVRLTHDTDDPRVFHLECTSCGHSTTITVPDDQEAPAY